jgi:lysophospholipase L1-like esterase
MKTYFEKKGEWKQFRYKDRPWDYIHTNNQGHQLIAQAIYAYLDRGQLIK